MNEFKTLKQLFAEYRNCEFITMARLKLLKKEYVSKEEYLKLKQEAKKNE